MQILTDIDTLKKTSIHTFVNFIISTYFHCCVPDAAYAGRHPDRDSAEDADARVGAHVPLEVGGVFPGANMT